MDVSALDLLKALVDIFEATPEVILAGLAEGVRVNSVDDPEGSFDRAEVRIGFGGMDLFDIKIERV